MGQSNKKLTDWSGNPFVCKKCNNVDEMVNIIEEGEGYPYNDATVKCSKCDYTETFFI